MPLTPFHMGPGCVAKAALGRHFSLMVFGFAQVLIDLEPLVRLLREGQPVHGYSHTLAGATVCGVVSLFAGRPVCAFVLRRLGGPERISWAAAALGAFFGAYSHIVLDAVMHAEMRPWWPLSDGNGLLDLVSMEALHLWCLAAALVGGLGVWLRYRSGRG